MIYILLVLLLGMACFYGGILLGIKDCKRRFGIPKGVQSMEEWTEYSVEDCEDFINE